MKKVLSILLTAALVFSLAACSTSNQSSDTSVNTTKSEEDLEEYVMEPRQITDRTLTVAIVPITMNTSYALTIKGAEQAVKEYGYDMEIVVQYPSSNTSSITEQGDILEDLIQQGVDAIVLSTESDSAMLPYLREAAEADIPLFLFNMSEIDALNNMYLSSIGYDQYEAGYVIGEWAVENFGDEPQQIGVLEGYPGVLNTTRMNGFNDAIADNKNMEVVASQTANWTREDGTSVTESILTSNPELTLLYGPYDEMVLGGITVIKERGLQDQVSVLGYGATEDGLNAIKNGEMCATVDVGEYGTGYDIIDAVHTFCVEGEEVDSVINRPCVVYDTENVDTFDMSIFED